MVFAHYLSQFKLLASSTETRILLNLFPFTPGEKFTNTWQKSHCHPPSVVTGREISMQAADWAFLKGGLPGPRRFARDTSALERRLPELQLWDVGLVQ